MFRLKKMLPLLIGSLLVVLVAATIVVSQWIQIESTKSNVMPSQGKAQKNTFRNSKASLGLSWLNPIVISENSASLSAP